MGAGTRTDGSGLSCRARDTTGESQVRRAARELGDTERSSVLGDPIEAFVRCFGAPRLSVRLRAYAVHGFARGDARLVALFNSSEQRALALRYVAVPAERDGGGADGPSFRVYRPPARSGADPAYYLVLSAEGSWTLAAADCPADVVGALSG